MNGSPDSGRSTTVSVLKWLTVLTGCFALLRGAQVLVLWMFSGDAALVAGDAMAACGLWFVLAGLLRLASNSHHKDQPSGPPPNPRK